MATEPTGAKRSHVVTVYRETKWPWQVIGSCICGRGIRCNRQREARAFFAREGCRKW